MKSLEKVITDLLQTSSLPEFYKTVLINMLPSISKLQKEELALMLARDQAKQSEINQRGEEICKYYETLAYRLENDPNELFTSMTREEGNVKTSKTKDASKASLSSMKQKVDLQSLKDQIRK